VTSSRASEVDRRRRRPRVERVSPEGDLLEGLLAMLDVVDSGMARQFRADPIGFFRRILGVVPWARQAEIIEAIWEHDRVACKSGHKVSKSNTAAGVALGFYSSFDDARVIMSSTTSRQVDQILWREVKMLRARGGRCVECKEAGRDERPCPHSALIEGDIGELARTGLKSADFREIVGFTAKEGEAVAGISGRRLLYIVDEASGVPDEIFEAIEGNRAGGAKILLLGNPTRTQGYFFDAFHEKKAFWHCITISSEESPNVVEGREVIPGLATREWIEEKKEEWGEDSPLYRVRVKGEFATREDGRIFSIHAIEQAEQLWHDKSIAVAGRLFLGVDPAGATGTGDESAFAARRGKKVLELVTKRGLTEEGHLVWIVGMLTRLRQPREIPVVVVDREGGIGSKLAVLLRSYADEHKTSLVLVSVRASDRAVRQPVVYDRMRDELAANLEAWFRDGGAIPEDTRLEGELHELEWEPQANGRVKITRKTQLRKALGRSPDRYDAVALCAWEPLSLSDESPVDDAGAPQRRGPRADDGGGGGGGSEIDPYGTGIDPYG